jgi:NAD(P)-dependent dehydrogenase (short-subunit alcohol dehydrogenase family)
MNILVTGGSSGIGRATVLELAGRGHRVLAAARRVEPLEELARAHEGIAAVAMDVTDTGSIERAREQVDDLTSGHGVDVLVNNAGYALLGPVEAHSPQAIEHQFATNVVGPIGVARAFLPRMRERGAGRIVNVSSVVGRFTLPGMGIYSATKFALEALSDAMRIELAPFGVSVVLVEPMFVATDLATGATSQVDGLELRAEGYEDFMRRSAAYLAEQLSPEKAISAETVARRIAAVAEAKRPKARYVVPPRARALVGLMQTLPDALADRAKARTVGLR